MVVKAHTEVLEALDRAESSLREAVSDVERTKASVIELDGEKLGLTLAELSSQSHVSEEALVAFAQTVGELLGQERSLGVEAARRSALLAVAGQVWESELGPLLGTAEARELLGVSRQRVDELLRAKRLIALLDSGGHRRYPAFQFGDGRPLPSLVAAFWAIADAAISPWTAASWCTAADEALEGLSPAAWARSGRDAAHLARIAYQDAARLAR